MTLSIGIDADVVQRLHAVRQGHITHLSYVWPIVQSIAEYEFPNLTLEMLQPTQPAIQLRWVFINKFPCYAGGLQFTPQGKPDDQLLDVAGMTDGSTLGRVAISLGYWAGRLEHSANAILQQFAELRLSAPSQLPVPYQLDGDPGGVLPTASADPTATISSHCRSPSDHFISYLTQLISRDDSIYHYRQVSSRFGSALVIDRRAMRD